MDGAQNEELAKYLRLQVARWKSTVGEIEDLLDNCVKSDAELTDLVTRCRVPGGHGRTDLESNQEAIIRGRMATQKQLGSVSYGSSSKKTRQERKTELLELRHELAKVSGMDEAFPTSIAEEEPLTPSSPASPVGNSPAAP
mmetsp:Transcript_131971/g.232382  ORF Transcript_131971/g.232382 Transcript_131971/m.232382 type:complete len:141 (-) Transcript_131971:213-635(-)